MGREYLHSVRAKGMDVYAWPKDASMLEKSGEHIQEAADQEIGGLFWCSTQTFNFQGLVLPSNDQHMLKQSSYKPPVAPESRTKIHDSE